jgi:hypothetical protein
MNDDIRNHDPAPTFQEAEWMSTDMLGVVVRAALLAVIALSVGLSASVVIDHTHRPATAAVSAQG